MDDLNKIVELNSERKKIFRMIVPCYPAFNIYSTVARETTALGSIMIATIVNMIPGWEAEIIDEMPRGGTGKILKSTLRKEYG